MTGSSATVLQDFSRLADRFGKVVDRLDDADWGRASPCEGWSAGDVLHHVISTQCDFLAQRGVDAATATDVMTDPRCAWHGHDDRVRTLLADPDVALREYDGVFGRTTVGASLVRFYGFDLVVHRWDIATAAGLDEGLDDSELSMIESAADGFGEHLYDDGICKPAVPAPAGADRQSRVLARLGRRATSDVA
jgi:uncharacterized protein (TIGR03086 family)